MSGQETIQDDSPLDQEFEFANHMFWEGFRHCLLNEPESQAEAIGLLMADDIIRQAIDKWENKQS